MDRLSTMSRRHPHRRRPVWESGYDGIKIRVGSTRSPSKYHEINARGTGDASRFARLVDNQTRTHPLDPLVVSVNGYQPWLREVLHSCIDDCWADISDLNCSVQFGNFMQFPEKTSKRGQCVPWTFIIDQMNVPQVYYWSVDMHPPSADVGGFLRMENFRFRTGVWFCARGACRSNYKVPVTIIFTKPTLLCEHVVTELLFDYLLRDQDLDQLREDEEGICWIFLRLLWLITDWQNIIGEVRARLDEAEDHSHSRRFPVKTRTRRMHIEVERIYELKECLHFHSRALKKLQKLKDDVPKNEQKNPLWTDMDDTVEDLDQSGSTLDSLKERFNNLIELEFNITNAAQADHSAFLTAVATLFLPVSFLASLFGMSTVSWPVVWYLWTAIPVFILSVVFTASFPWVRRRVQTESCSIEDIHLRLRPNHFTMLGNELPANVNASAESRPGQIKHRRTNASMGVGVKSLSPRSTSPR